MGGYLYGGVDHAIPGNGGPHCVQYISMIQRCLETAVVVLVCGALVRWGWKRLTFPKRFSVESQDNVYCRAYLALFCLVFGVELTYKVITGTLIFIFNPCHITTILQIYLLLSSADSRVSSGVYRFQQYLVSGTTLALLFPVVNTRLLPGEIPTYYLQHIMLLITPIVLANGGSFAAEDILDFSWASFAVGTELLYHFIPLQIIGLVTKVNVNNVICPAVSDPFQGKYWRICAVLHQSFYITVHGKLHSMIAQLFSSLIFKRCSTEKKSPVKKPENPVGVIDAAASRSVLENEVNSEESRRIYLENVRDELVRRGYVSKVNNGFHLTSKTAPVTDSSPNVH